MIKKRGFTLIELLIVIGVLAVLATAVVLVLNPAEMLRRARDSQRISDLRSVKDAISIYLVRTPQADLNGNSLDGICQDGNETSYIQWRISIDSDEQTINSVNHLPFIGSASVPQTPAQVSDPRLATGGGWIPINLSGMGLSKLPVDPKNIATDSGNGSGVLTSIDAPSAGFQPASYFYAYQCQGLRYEIMANMESRKYGSNDDLPPLPPDPESIENKDGGKRARNQSANGGAGLIDPISPICGQAGQVSCSYIADQVYQVGNDPDLDL